MSVRDELAEFARSSIGPIDGQYLRPWACAGNPTEARVFLVGVNPATAFPADMIDASDLVDALLAPDGRLIDELYRRLRPIPSPTRRNIDMVVGRLRSEGVQPILETNVWSLPTKSLANLRAIGRTASTARDSPLPDLVRILQPAVVIVHGTASREGVESVLGIGLPVPAPIADPPATALIGSVRYFTLLSLSPPQANMWLPRASEHLALLARQVVDIVAASAGPSVES